MSQLERQTRPALFVLLIGISHKLVYTCVHEYTERFLIEIMNKC